MATSTLSILELRPGLKLAENVHTSLGGLLLPKDRVLLPRDLDVLRAFLIQHVEIDHSSVKPGGGTAVQGRMGKEASVKELDSPSADPRRTGLSLLQDEYEKMIFLVKSAYQSVMAGLPIYDLRNQLDAMFVHIKHYHILNFIPRSMNEQDYMFHNAVLTALTSYTLAQWNGLPQKDWMQVAFAGLLHDIGNAKVDPVLLHKPSPLTAEELSEVRMHTTYGYQLLKNVTAINEGVRLAALQHHEKVDGSGYPGKLNGSNIHIYAKIVAVADIFHAMTLKKAYRKAQSPYLVLEQIQLEAFGKLDPVIVQNFINRVTQFHHGTMVRLSNDQIGEIIFTDRDHPTRPMVNINGEIINLVQQRHLYIEELVSI